MGRLCKGCSGAGKIKYKYKNINYFLYFQLFNAHAVSYCMGVRRPFFLIQRKGDKLNMRTTQQYREHIEYTFNAFCKIVLYHAALGEYKRIRKKQRFEVPIDDLRRYHFGPMTEDEYFVGYDMPTVFTVHGETLIVESETLAAALLRMPEKWREVLFLRYYLGYSDEEIGKMCGISRSAVFRRRKRTLHFIRTEMKVLENEE